MKPFVTPLSALEEKAGLARVGEERVFCPCDEAFYYCCLSAEAHTIQGGEAGLREPSEERHCSHQQRPEQELQLPAPQAARLHHSAEQLPCLLPLLKGKPPHRGELQRRASPSS